MHLRNRLLRTLGAGVLAGSVLATMAVPAFAYTYRDPFESTRWQDCIDYAAVFGIDAALKLPGCGPGLVLPY